MKFGKKIQLWVGFSVVFYLVLYLLFTQTNVNLFNGNIKLDVVNENLNIAPKISLEKVENLYEPSKTSYFEVFKFVTNFIPVKK